ncbi:hypothetical protein BDV59DRAFT_138594 [Aspergillus ambiguus]|uniref:uncharacterized protein n=1 Tax=Aspergillus ambiguus TaxID=176160 RepID=UPI003CCDC15F
MDTAQNCVIKHDRTISCQEKNAVVVLQFAKENGHKVIIGIEKRASRLTAGILATHSAAPLSAASTSHLASAPRFCELVQPVSPIHPMKASPSSLSIHQLVLSESPGICAIRKIAHSSAKRRTNNAAIGWKQVQRSSGRTIDSVPIAKMRRTPCWRIKGETYNFY